MSLDYLLKDEVTEETPVEISGQAAHDAAFASDRRKYILYSIIRRAFACLLFFACAVVIVAVKEAGERELMTLKEFIENRNQLNGSDYVDDFVWQERFEFYIEQANSQMFSENHNTICGIFFALVRGCGRIGLQFRLCARAKKPCLRIKAHIRIY